MAAFVAVATWCAHGKIVSAMEKSCSPDPEPVALAGVDGLREQVDNCLREVESQIDGFPVELLLRDLLHAVDKGPCARAEKMDLVESLLTYWIATLERDLRLLAPPCPPVLVSIKVKMQSAQTALIHVQAMLDRLRSG